MKLNILCTSKPVDGLLYYSYEYCCWLNSIGIDTDLIIVRHRDFSAKDYVDTLCSKYVSFKNVLFDTVPPGETSPTLIMGRSMMTLAWQSFNNYTAQQQQVLLQMFSGNVISVYSENHPEDYPRAVEFFSPAHIIDLCDTEVYPNGVGDHFEKTINFEIYRPHVDNVQFKYLFLGTNERYYAAVEKVIDQFPDHGILTYDANYVNINNNNIRVPVENLLGLFDTYIYVKETFDPAPRIIQECKYFGKEVIYLRDPTIIDGGSVYWKRDIKQPDVTPILNSIKKFK
jgi:hypothetical protein